MGEDDDVVYNVVTNLPVYENGTSANTGSGSSPPKKTKREVDEKEKERREKRAAQKKQRLAHVRRNWRRTPGAESRVGTMGKDELWWM